MKPLPIILSIFFEVIAVYSNGQVGKHVEKYHIDSSNQKAYYQQAQHLMHYKNKDSLLEAFVILRNLHYFDSTVYSTNFLKPSFKAIERINYNDVRKNILGCWIFEWTGNNIFPSKAHNTKNEKVIFTRRKAFFYKNDTLVRRTRYELTNRFSSELKEFNFRAFFFDDKTSLNVYLKESGADYNAGLKFSNKNVGLYLSKAWGSETDVDEDIYMKINSSGYH